MPTYEYVCTSCGTHVEAVQSFTDDPLTTCAECGGTLRKVFGSVGIVLKGSGFYKTDSRSADAATVGKGSGGEGGNSSSTSSDGGSGSSGSEKSSGPTSTSGSSDSGSATKAASPTT